MGGQSDHSTGSITLTPTNSDEFSAGDHNLKKLGPCYLMSISTAPTSGMYSFMYVFSGILFF